MARLVKRPRLSQVLAFCAGDPIERVFLEDVARRGLGRFAGLREAGQLTSLLHLGANLVPSGAGCAAFAELVAKGEVEMAQNYALEPWEVEAGFVLACQSRPTTPELELDYDQR